MSLKTRFMMIPTTFVSQNKKFLIRQYFCIKSFLVFFLYNAVFGGEQPVYNYNPIHLNPSIIWINTQKKAPSRIIAYILLYLDFLYQFDLWLL